MPKSLHLKYIAVEGPIGVGKTTMAKMLAEDMGAELCLEPAATNPFLSEFYKDRRKNAFKTQLYFLLSRYQQQQELARGDDSAPMIISDYTFAKDAVFAKINLTDDEMMLYNTVFRLLKDKLVKPDLVLYMRAEPGTILKRIRKRGFDYERPITESYLEQLIDSYNAYFMDYSDTPLLVVDTTEQDYIANPEHFANLKREILNHRGGTVHFIARE